MKYLQVIWTRSRKRTSCKLCFPVIFGPVYHVKLMSAWPFGPVKTLELGYWHSTSKNLYICLPMPYVSLLEVKDIYYISNKCSCIGLSSL